MGDFLQQLADRLKTADADVVSADEIADWPVGKIDELVKTGVLEEIQQAKGLVCCECEENCYIEPDVRTHPDTGKATGVYICTNNPDIGRIEIDLDRLKQWKINTQKLSELGYQVQVGWVVPWDETNTEYFTLKEAVNLANDDSITIKAMSRLLENLDFPVRRMHMGRRCRIHITDYRNWLKYAQHGQITDEAIEKYLQGAETRKKTARKKKTRL